jgi:hypothetical protein
MGLAHGTNIVNDGLVFSVDAANPRSYPGSGTAWNSLKNSNNSVTLTNGPEFQTAANGNIYFDGGTDIGIISYDSSLISTTSHTIEMWLKLDNIGSNSSIFITNRDGSDSKVNFMLSLDNRQLVRPFNPSGNDTMVVIYTISNGSVSYYAYKDQMLGTTNGDGKYHQIIGTYSKSDAEQKLYYDGELQMTLAPSIDLYNSTQDIRVAGGYDGNTAGSTTPQNISSIKMYHKALTAQEVKQNYNALKGRFGL